MFFEKINAGFKKFEFVTGFYKKFKRLKNIIPFPDSPVNIEIFSDHFAPRRRYRVE